MDNTFGKGEYVRPAITYTRNVYTILSIIY